MYGADDPHTVEYQIYRGEATHSSAAIGGHVTPILGTPKVSPVSQTATIAAANQDPTRAHRLSSRYA